MPTPWQRDLEEGRERFGAWLRRRLGGASRVRVGELTAPQSSGFSNETLLCDAEWEERGKPRAEALVVRIQPTGLRVFPFYDMALQFRTMQRLAGTAVSVPRMLWLEQEDTSVFGAPFYVMERVEGRVPSDNPPYHAEGWMTQVTPGEREAIWYGGIDAMCEIHRLDHRALGFGELERPELGPTALDQHLCFYERYYAWARRDRRPHLYVEPGFEYLRKHQPKERREGLLWGDARIGNVIFQGTRVAAVLDWEMVALGSGESDLAWTIFLDRFHSEAAGRPRLPGFPSYADTVARYEARTGWKIENLEYYMIFSGVRFSIIMMRLAQQMEHYSVLPPDSDFEMKNPVSLLLAKDLGLPF